ncbi:MAG: RHS repeat protein, partial [Clostridia bacterium]|nr:RHS repeat protein [Clostridia bacterium]
MDEIKIGAHEIYLAPENITLEKAEKENNELSEVIKNEDIALKGEAEPKENIHKKEIVDLRKGNRKVYRMADGTEQAVIYSKAVHAFNEETKEFDEVDNTLVEDGEHKHLINSKNGFIAKFSQEETNDELFSIENGMHRVTVLARKNKKQKNKGVKPNVRRKFDFSDIDVVNFSNIEAATDYEYSVESDGVKENIVIKEKLASYRYPFILKCENVVAKFEEENKRITFLSKEHGNEVFYIPAPFMVDANGATSSKVSYEMRAANEDDVYLTVKADGAWLNDEKRAFPIVIDPQIRLSTDTPIITYGWTNGTLLSGTAHTVGTVACDIKTDVGTGAPNESFACCAKEICVGDWMQDSITRSGETVCYRFETKAGTGNYTIATHGSLDTVGALYDAFGHIITRGDDERKPNFAMTATLKGGEIYYFTVRAFSSKTGDYDVGVVYEGAISDRYENNRLYMNLEMPSLPNNPRIKKAELKFFQHSSSYLQASCNKLGLYHVTEEIGSENFTDEFDENLIDFALMKPGSSENNAEICYSFDITSLMDAFIKNEITSHNLVLKTIGECTACESNVVLYGSECNNKFAPQIVVTYESTYGVNTSYRTHTHELGKFGQGSIDLQCGNLMLESEDFAWGGNRMPVTIKHLYNSALSDYNYTANSLIKLDSAYFGSMKLGKGFKLNVMQSIVKKGDEYVYISENGDATYLKESKETVRCDSNTQCYPLYKPEEDSDMSYDYVKRILKQGEEVYQFDANGRLISIADDNNKMLINYIDGKISSIVDGAGREFAFNYSGSFLTEITAPDGSNIEYSYNGDLLSSVTYPDGTKAVITYLLNKPKEIILSDSNNSPVYKVEYTFNGERVESVTEYGAQNGEFVMGNTSSYSYSAASGRTVVETTEQADGDEAENNVIKTVYTFDDDGNIISEYVYSEDKGNMGANGEESGINPHSGDGGAGVVSNINNLLVGHSFESLGAWPSMACNCGDIYINNYTDETAAKFGKKVLCIKTNTACVENGVYQVTNVLPAGEYTFSAYVKPITNITDAEQNGAYIRVTTTDGTVIGVSECISKKDSEFIRLVVPFELSTEQSVVVQLLVNGKGTVYFNAPQLENNPFANAYNMLENGNFELDTAWNKNGAYYNSITRFNMNKAMSIIGNLDKKCYAYQKVYVKTNAGTRETFTLSGWAKGWGLPTHAQDSDCKPTFRLRAVVKYSNGETDPYFADFSPCTEEWQLASVQFAKNKYAKVEYIEVFCEYDYNSGVAYFDDIQLIRNSIETGLSDADFKDETEDADTDTTTTDNTETAAETATTEEDNGFKELIDKYGNTLTETTFTDGEFGTIYRAFAFNADTNCICGNDAGNNLIRETDARGNITKYTVDEETSRNEEVIDRCGNKTAYEYDELGRTTKVTSKNALDEEIANVSYNYDSFDNLTQIVRGDGLEYALKYNAFHNLEAIAVKGDENNEDINLIKYTYKNGNGRLKEMTYANGDKMTATYNGIGQMIAEKWFDKDGVLTAYYKYVYDGQGNIVRSIDILAQKEYNYLYEDGKIMQSTESAIVLDECTNMVISKTAVC